MVPLPRRDFLRLGALGCTGLTLPRLLQAREQQPATRRRSTSVILYWLAGGPSHIDTYDPKPDAPMEVRGPFKTIPTRTAGMQLTELLTGHAKVADRFSLVRSLCHSHFVHDDASHWVQTGWPNVGARERGQQYPCQGSVVSQVRGATQQGMPSYVCIPDSYHVQRGFYQKAAFLGREHDPINAGGMEILGKYRQPDFALPVELSAVRADDRRQLLHSLNAARQQTQHTTDTYHQRAFELITSPAVQTAFDLNREPARVRERYGHHLWGRSALLARRLVEAGTSFVTINHYEAEIDWWDDHTQIEKNLKRRLPLYDQALSTLLDDLHQRGLANDVLVVAVGEFGRGPKIDAQAGRSHWAKAFSALLSGGGIQSGRVLGSTTSNGGEPKDRPLSPGDLLATIYRVLGIDSETTITDRQARPVKLFENGEPIHELF